MEEPIPLQNTTAYWSQLLKLNQENLVRQEKNDCNHNFTRKIALNICHSKGTDTEQTGVFGIYECGISILPSYADSILGKSNKEYSRTFSSS